MKRSFSIILLSTLLFNGVGFYLYYALKLQQIRKEMREALKHLPDNELDVIRLTNREFANAIVEDHEIKVKGRMYDIARVIHNETSVVVYCKHDEKEDNLIALLDHVMSAPVKGDSTAAAFSSFMNLVFLKSEFTSDISRNSKEQRNSTPYFFSQEIFFQSPLSPPPRLSL